SALPSAGRARPIPRYYLSSCSAYRHGGCALGSLWAPGEKAMTKDGEGSRMKWALFFAPVAVSAAVMLFASVVLTEDAEAPRRATLFERDSESEPDVELEPAGLFVQGPDAEASREGAPRARQLPERQPRRAPLGGPGSR